MPAKKTSKKVRKAGSIVLAVTGHRNINQNDKALSKRVAKECDALRAMYPDREFIILSGLAEGADRLVAKVTMKSLEAKLVSVLAVPEESFMMDFSSAASKRSFKKFLSESAFTITAPLMSKTAWQEYTASRNHQYAWEGAFLARHAHVLIALWDGAPARGVGGTAHVVRWFKRRQVPKKYLIQSDVLAKQAGLPKLRKSDKRHFIHIEP